MPTHGWVLVPVPDAILQPHRLLPAQPDSLLAAGTHAKVA